MTDARRVVGAHPSLRRGLRGLRSATGRALLVFFALALSGARASAEPAGEEQAPAASAAPSASATPGSVVPPRARDAAAPYPEGARGDAVVELELDVDREGQVTAVRVRSGAEPFASSAQRSAAGWRFEPATRDGAPLSVTIRYEVAYRYTEVPRPVDTAVSLPPPVDATPQNAPPPPVEIVVRGEREPPGVTTLTSAESRQLPGAFGDPFRAIEVLPGVTPIVSGIPFFYVRGAPPGNVGYFVDGVRVPLLFHAFVGPAVLHPASTERVDLYRGGYPAEFGRFAGGIVSARTLRPEPRVRGEASARLIDSGAMLSAPFAREQGSVLLAGRYSYTSLILSQLMPGIGFGYWDYQGLASYALGADDRVGVLVFGARDHLDQDDNRSSTEFHRVDVRWDHDLDRRTHARIAATLGTDRIGTEEGSLRDRMAGGRLALEHTASPQLTLRGGTDVEFDRYELDLPSTSFDDLFDEEFARDAGELMPSRDELVWGSYVDAVLTPEPWLMVTPGLRVDLFQSQGHAEVGVDPRILARFGMSERITVEHALGIAHQSSSYIPGVPAARSVSVRGGLQRSIQASSGVELALPLDLSLTATLFDNVFLNLNDPLGTSGEITTDPRVLERRALGSAYGLELFLRRPLTRRVGGFFAYTLSRTTRSYGKIEGISAFDRTHVVNLALGFDLGRRWTFGGRLLFFSGVPTRSPSSAGPVFDGSERAPAFARLDLRLEKRWRLGARGSWGLTAEVLNSTLSKEITRRSCNRAGCTEDAVGPIFVPSLGVDVRY